jgi:hypothetical protein
MVRGDLADRREIAQGIVRQLLVDDPVHGEHARRAVQQRIAVGLGARHRLGADDPVRARAIVDDDLLAPIRGQLLRQQPDAVVA